MRFELEAGALEAPSSWLRISRAELAEPPTQSLGAPLALAGPGPQHLSVRALAWASSAEPEAALDALVRGLVEQVPGLKILDRRPFVFEDGTEAPSVTIACRLAGVSAVQRHVVRRHADRLLHLSGAAPEGMAAALERRVQPVLASFRPHDLPNPDEAATPPDPNARASEPEARRTRPRSGR
jgi:hypothetical protein